MPLNFPGVWGSVSLSLSLFFRSKRSLLCNSRLSSRQARRGMLPEMTFRGLCVVFLDFLDKKPRKRAQRAGTGLEAHGDTRDGTGERGMNGCCDRDGGRPYAVYQDYLDSSTRLWDRDTDWTGVATT
ncbi:hypothetical protein F4778DRAFT_214462 [Xylariomycetidae sp. FL2044]|nr:hypothetical protein F4778DRAFT_214462 [Xylariomycetidae sp. FL2044]